MVAPPLPQLYGSRRGNPRTSTAWGKNRMSLFGSRQNLVAGCISALLVTSCLWQLLPSHQPRTCGRGSQRSNSLAGHLVPPWTSYAQTADPKATTSGCTQYRNATWPLGQLQLEGGWQSRLPRLLTDITLVTQGSLTRVERMVMNAVSFGGVISVALFVAVVDGKVLADGGARSTMREAVAQLGAIHAMLERKGGCKVDVALYSQAFEDVHSTWRYPINALRNRALLMAETELVLLMDLDCMVSRDVSNPAKYVALVEAARAHKAVVLPTFGTLHQGPVGRSHALRAIQGGKAEAVALWRRGELEQFRVRAYPPGHHAVNYTRWSSAREMYPVTYKKDFEPYVIVSRSAVPLYDERFVAYFYNRQTQLYHMYTLDFHFVVHPTEYAVHIPHPRSKSAVAAQQEGFMELGFQLAVELREAMWQHEYKPVTTTKCHGARSNSSVAAT